MSGDVLICLTRTDDDQEVTEGSVIRWCSVCATEVWVSPSSLEYVDDGRLTPACEPCGFGMVAADEEPTFTALPNASAEQRRLIAALNRAMKGSS